MTVSNPADQEKIRKALSEISDSYTRIAAEKDLIKDIVSEISENFDLPKRTVNKMAKVYYKQNFHEEQQSFEEFEALYEEVVGSTV